MRTTTQTLALLFALTTTFGCDQSSDDFSDREGDVLDDAQEDELDDLAVDETAAAEDEDAFAQAVAALPDGPIASVADLADPVPVPEPEADIDCPDPDAPGVAYLFEDPAECSTISILCAPGYTNIPGACGCGCMGSDPGPRAFAAN